MKKETSTIVRVKPTSDPKTTFISFTICPDYHSAYKREVLKNHNMTVRDYRDKNAMWYPPQDANYTDAREFFHNITYEIHEVIEKIKISTMSLNKSEAKIYITQFENFKQENVEFHTQYEDTYGRCYTVNATQRLLDLGLKYVEFIARMGVYIFIEHPGQHLHGNSRSKVMKIFYHKISYQSITFF